MVGAISNNSKALQMSYIMQQKASGSAKSGASEEANEGPAEKMAEAKTNSSKLNTFA